LAFALCQQERLVAKEEDRNEYTQNRSTHKYDPQEKMIAGND